MNDPAASLDRLHDLVLPPDVPWWPPAPGWYGLFALLILAAAWLAWQSWRRWQANAYRRAALHELESLKSSVAIAELLRRTALASVPRPVVSGMTGATWTDWLAAQSPEAMSPEVQQLLTVGIYDRLATTDREFNLLRDYAARWIVRHQLVPIQLSR